MFWHPRPKVIESDRGFSVEGRGRSELIYTEGEKTLQIDCEFLVGPILMVVYGSSIQKWDPPHDKEPIDEQKRESILQNIREAFRFEGYEIKVE